MPGIAEQVPGAADRVARLEDRVALARALGLQVVGGADPGEAGADDQDVEVLGRHGVATEGSRSPSPSAAFSALADAKQPSRGCSRFQPK